jgi:DNA-3-methyladenine glycosylase
MTIKRSTSKLLRRTFFNRSPEIVAPDLLGKILVHQLGAARLSGRIMETEAYLGLSDPASHAYSGKSAANAVLFGPPGLAHVYLIYGLHNCLSISAHLKDAAGGVLIRALLPLEGIEVMARLRGKPGNENTRWLTGGPGRVCEAFGIDRSMHNSQDVTARLSPLQIVEDGFRCGSVSTTKRIGITKAAEQPLRFVCQPEVPDGTA